MSATKLSYRDRRRAARAYWGGLRAWKHGLEQPTRAEWVSAVAGGFHPDGCTYCPDTVWGVRIGISSDMYLPKMPCNLHDYRFHVGGGLQEYATANIEFYQGMYSLVLRKAHWLVRNFALSRCSFIYHVVSSPLSKSHFNWRIGNAGRRRA